MNKIFPLLSLAMLFFIFTNSVGQDLDNSLKSLITEAIQVSPKIELLKSKRNVAKSKIENNTNLEDPILTLGLINMPTNSFSFNQEPMTGKIIGLSQSFPFPGGLGRKSDVFAMDTLIVEQEIEDFKNEIRKKSLFTMIRNTTDFPIILGNILW